MKKGFIYILSNNSLKENLIKIGKTTKTAIERSKELSSSTSIPESFEIIAEYEFIDINWAEKKIHSTLSNFRHNKRKEFFCCEHHIAKAIIIEIQIEDKNKQIEGLKKDLSKLKIILDDSEFLISKWEKFFTKLKWSFEIIKQNRNEFLPNFILQTKQDYIIGFDEIEKEPILKISNKPALVFLVPNLNLEYSKIDEIEYINAIESQSKVNNRIFIISNMPFETYTEVYIGWKYEYNNKCWEKIKFIDSQDNYGLLEESPSWFCLINGFFAGRENIFPNKNLIMKLWDNNNLV
jgi:hypothetical protein